MVTKIFETSNFSFEEFTYSEIADHYVPLTTINKWLIKHLVRKILQPIRDQFGQVKINSGLRDIVIWSALGAAGYAPSRTTDHSFLDPGVNQWGVGAVDFEVVKGNTEEAFWWAINEDLSFGQIIYYQKRGHIHISNPKELVFSPNFLTDQKLYVKKINRCLIKNELGEYEPAMASNQ